MPDFLLEIGCEEIPSRMIDAAARDLSERMRELLERERLLLTDKIEHLDSPRRLAVLAPGIRSAQPDLTERLTGPSVSVGYRDGEATPAAHAFAKKAGIDVSRLERINTAKGEYLAATVTRPGRSATDVLCELIPREIDSLSWPKNMYWRKPGELFVRPIRWLVAMLDGEVIPVEYAGVRAGSLSRGHRILSPGPVEVPRADDSYVEALRRAYVFGRAEREQQIRRLLDSSTRSIAGARWREDRELLDTVVNLTEYPSVILGNFEPEFLELPEEVLVTVMRDHQRYFAVEDGKGRLLAHFLAVLNTDGEAHGVIRHGHERVLRARFKDARFFWQTDQKYSLRERAPWLRKVTFQKDLGNYYEKTLRIQRLCSWLCEVIRQHGVPVRPGVVHKAALLAKSDLTTELVKEFTELQGIVGGLYAGSQELDRGIPAATRKAIAEAVYDHYKPVANEDQVPRSVEGAVLSVADKADSIAGMFALGLQPSGSKDPFALRRQANGIVKTIAQKRLPLRLGRLFEYARETYRGSEAEKKFPSDFDYPGALELFFRERLEFYLRDVLGFDYDVVGSVLAVDADDAVDAVDRASSVAEMRGSRDFESLSVAFKRIKNILRQAGEAGGRASAAVDSQLLLEPAERELAEKIVDTAKVVEGLREQRNYSAALVEISRLRPIVDKFFEKVMVMVEDERIRANRLALLGGLLREFSTIADFSEIVTEGRESKGSPTQ
jgi:glycyl-tRNA synthetase beta chain